MIISHEHKFIYIHIHKTAGTSISKTLEPYLGPDDEMYGINGTHGTSEANRLRNIQENQITTGQAQNPHGQHPWKHSFAKDIKLYVGEEIWNTYHKFAFIRNPYGIYTSFYHWLKGRTTPPKWSGGIEQQDVVQSSKSFSEYVTKYFNSEMDISEDPLWGHTLCDYICDDDGRVMVDYVGRYENLGFDLGFLFANIGLPRTQVLKRNWSNHKYYPLYYTEECIRIIEGLHHYDLEKFGYSFGDGKPSAWIYKLLGKSDSSAHSNSSIKYV